MKKFRYILPLLMLSIVQTTSLHCQSWQWLSRLGGGGIPINTDIPDEMVRGMVTDSLGNVYACGRIRAEGNPNVNGAPISAFGAYDFFVAKFDCNGNLVWIRTGGSHMGNDDATHILSDGQGHLYVAGRVDNAGFSNYWVNFMGTVISENTNDMYLCKLDTAGTLLWVKWASPGNVNTLSSVYGMDFTSSGNIKVIIYSSTGNIFPGQTINLSGVYIGEFDTSGSFTIDFNFHVFQTGQGLRTIGMKLDANNNHYIIGDFTSDSLIIMGQTLYKISNPSTGSSDMFLVKVSNQGNLEWIEHIGKQGMGMVNYAGGVVCLDSFSIAITGRAPKNQVIGSDTLINIQNGSGVCYVAVYNQLGIPLWTVNSSHQSSTLASGGLLKKSNNNIVYSGFFGGTAIFGLDSIVAIGTKEVFIAEINPSGNLIAGISINGTGNNDEPRSLAVDKDDNIFVGGGFNGTLDIGGSSVTSQGGYTDAFIAKFGNICSVGLNEDATLSDHWLKLYPNPVVELLHVEFSMEQPLMITVLNMLGALVAETPIERNTSNHVSMNVSHLPPGIYLVRLQSKSGTVTKKIVKGLE